jgi:hypothetical protein
MMGKLREADTLLDEEIMLHGVPRGTANDYLYLIDTIKEPRADLLSRGNAGKTGAHHHKVSSLTAPVKTCRDDGIQDCLDCPYCDCIRNN